MSFMVFILGHKRLRAQRNNPPWGTVPLRSGKLEDRTNGVDPERLICWGVSLTPTNISIFPIKIVMDITPCYMQPHAHSRATPLPHSCTPSIPPSLPWKHGPPLRHGALIPQNSQLPPFPQTQRRPTCSLAQQGLYSLFAATNPDTSTGQTSPSRLRCVSCRTA
jgi:hypothetical protein